jgi:DNA replication protein DnaC
MQQMLQNNLKKLQLSTMLTNLESSLRQACDTKIDYDEFLFELTSLEVKIRAENRLKRLIREAKFPIIKPLETFDFDAVPDLNTRLFKELVQCTYIREHKNVIFLGRSGCGKTHMATTLGLEACKNDFRTRFVSCFALTNELIEAREQITLQRIITKYSRYDLLILDELGYIPFTKEGSELLFQILAARHEKRSTIITTNLGFGDWTQVFQDKTLTTALLDRLTYNAHIFNCKWKSYRLRQSLKNQAG